MVPFEDAFKIVMEQAHVLDAEEVEIAEALHRILAEDVHSDIDMPPFDKSAMDGYACRRADLARELSILEIIQAGSAPTKSVGAGECSKIMTGAPVPSGADCVIMVEYTENPTENTVRFTGTDTRDNICFKSEDMKAGDLVLHKGTRIAPQHIATLATVGCVRPRVARCPRVAVISTGDELVEPGEKPEKAQIRSSNGYQLCAQVAAVPAIPVYYGTVKDTEDAIDRVLKDALSSCDFILLSGGVSMGDFDLVPGTMESNGLRILFDSIAMKPGKPTTFGVSPKACCLGLPGNPVSTFIQFEILVKPFLFALMGHAYRAPRLVLPLAKTLTRKRADREAWVPVSITEDGRVIANEYHGSAHVNALCDADGLLVIPKDISSVKEGTLVSVRPI